MMDYISDIEGLCSTKLEKTIGIRLSKKFSKNSWNDLSDLSLLVYSFYINGKEKEIAPILDEVSKIKFSGKFDVWTPIAYCMALNYFLAASKSKKDEIHDSILQPVKYKELKFPSQGQAYPEEILKKKKLEMAIDGLVSAKKDGTKRELYESRVSVLSNLLLILAVNNGKDSKLDDEIFKLVDIEIKEIDKNAV